MWAFLNFKDKQKVSGFIFANQRAEKLVQFKRDFSLQVLVRVSLLYLMIVKVIRRGNKQTVGTLMWKLTDSSGQP